jgi:hypothetical protein
MSRLNTNVSKGGKFKLYTVLNGLIFPTPTQPGISFERSIYDLIYTLWWPLSPCSIGSSSSGTICILNLNAIIYCSLHINSTSISFFQFCTIMVLISDWIAENVLLTPCIRHANIRLWIKTFTDVLVNYIQLVFWKNIIVYWIAVQAGSYQRVDLSRSIFITLTVFSISITDV